MFYVKSTFNTIFFLAEQFSPNVSEVGRLKLVYISSHERYLQSITHPSKTTLFAQGYEKTDTNKSATEPAE